MRALLVALALASVAAADEVARCEKPCEELSLDGRWAFAPGAGDRASPGARVPVEVPGNWFRQGHDVTGGWFVRSVSVPAGRYALRFDGVDYAATVSWDGREIGSHRGYFAPFELALEATGRGPHELAVRVDSPLEPPSAWSLHKTLVKGVLAHHDTRPGGAWSERGQEANTGGIWGSVRLVRVHDGRVAQLSALVSGSAGEAVVTARVRVLELSRPASLRVTLRAPGGEVVARAERALAGAQEVEVRLGVARPEWWWPRELGPQPLYVLEASLGGRDRRAIRLGLRTLAHDRHARLLVNGVPVFLRGVNAIPTLYLADADRALVGRDLDLMRAAHVNAVRVHAHVTSPAFYELCDERGLLVFQDFPLQWGYSDAPAFAREALRQAGELVDAFGHHASIVRWTMHNEPPWTAPWMASKYPDYDPDQNRALDRALADHVAARDPSRPVEEASHTEAHLWKGWYSHSLAELDDPVAQPFITEFGAQAVPDVATLRTFLAPGKLWPFTPDAIDEWSFRNFQLDELRRVAKVPVGDDLQTLVANTQAYQARLVQAAAEGLRRQLWQPVGGIFQFFFNEHWPSVSWGLVDYRREPKEGYRALARAYQPTLPIAAPPRPGASLALWVVHEGARALDTATLEVFVERGRERTARAAIRVSVPARSVVRLDTAVPRPRDDERLVLELKDGAGAPLASNEYGSGYFRAVFGEPE